ncbi:helix-turn-helix transcriptional regulator [Rhizobium cauense]|uniref:helix-turn-helix domain-containing protein n=1 Tax=Rhizobium cauense TaxID=1166683 RepID=UPI001C6E560A|nr:AraC family transcriptional regulator [Rhizobium cauense]MBW9116459.1 helix-turn-helix transcriptional regulator [Rhizobium cauense]
MFATGKTVKPADDNLGASASAEVRRLLMHALDCYQHDGANAVELVTRASRILVGHDPTGDDDFSSDEPPGRGLARWQRLKVEAYVAGRLSNSIPIGDLARVANLSTSYFCTLFKTTFGRSPHAYVAEQRVEYAKHLMEATDAPLSQIALSCGLADQAHLSRLFRRVVGVTPSAWRRRVRVTPVTTRAVTG